MIKEVLDEKLQSIIDIIDDEIKKTKIQSKKSIDSCDKNYFSGYIDALTWIKDFIKV